MIIESDDDYEQEYNDNVEDDGGDEKQIMKK